MLSLAQVLCPEHAFSTGWNEPLAEGCHVQVGNNRGPIYQIVSVAGTVAWVRPVANGQEGLVPIDRLRPVAPPIA